MNIIRFTLITTITVFLAACSLTAAEESSLAIITQEEQKAGAGDLLVIQSDAAASTTDTPPAEEERPKRDKIISSYEDVQKFMAEMIKKHQLDKDVIQATFDKTKFDYSIVDLMDRPAEKRSWSYYYTALVSKQRVNDGSAYLKTNKSSLEEATKIYKVPAKVIVAVIGIETSYGKVALRRTAVQSLSTLAFEYPRRAPYFLGELESLLLLAHKQGVDPLYYMGSYAGAVGIPQFMPSNMTKYGKDGDGDEIIDIVNNHADAIHSVGNYLRMHGWQDGKSTVTLVELEKELAESEFTSNICAVNGKRTVKQLKALGVKVPEQYKDDEKGFLVRLEEEDEDGSFQPAIFFENACPIYKYNRSLKYTAAISMLAESFTE